MINQFSINHDFIGDENDSKELRQVYESNKLIIVEKLKPLKAVITFMKNGDIVFISDAPIADIRKVLADNKLKVNTRNQSKQIYRKRDLSGNIVNESIRKYKD